ncbi:MAG: hypothetical protein ACPGLV_01715 [Bacteroidia bacterium]
MKKKTIITIIALTLAGITFGQEGTFIDVIGFGQYTNIKNDFDVNYGPGKGLGFDYSLPQTPSYGGSILFAKMTETYVGFKTGLRFSNYSQFTSSKVELGDRDSVAFDALMNIKQISAPIMANFSISSGATTDRVYFSMGFGFQINYLFGANYNLTNDRDYPTVTTFEFSDYYYRLGASYLLALELKIELGKKKRTYLIAGINYDKTIGGIEKPDQGYGADVPRELTLPLGVLKDYNYDVPGDRVGYKTKNEALAFKLGVSIRLSK